MSAAEHETGHPVEPRSSVKLILNAAGKVQIEVRAVAGDDPEALDDARSRAVATFTALQTEYPR